MAYSKPVATWLALVVREHRIHVYALIFARFQHPDFDMPERMGCCAGSFPITTRISRPQDFAGDHGGDEVEKETCAMTFYFYRWQR